MSSYRIVADSGSTKTDWVIIDEDGNIADRLKSIGFNPYFQSSEFIFNEVQKAFSDSKIEAEAISEVNYYGAGCSSKEKTQIVEHALTSHFPKAVVHVDHDLVAAARASLGNEPGIACIIGTGSNSCVWEDGIVKANVPSHGYIFGDEGSGSYLGIRLVKLFLEDRLNPVLVAAFQKQFKLSKDQILNATYKEKDPNVFLAHFASFYHPHLDDPVLRNIVLQGFDDFFNTRVRTYEGYQNYELGFVGSIAWFYQNELREVADRYGMTVRKIGQCPIDELVKFHIQETVLKTA